MRRVILVLPGLVGSPDEESVLRSRAGWARFAESSSIAKVSALPPVETPEAAWLGLDPQTVKMRQGPLTVAALGVDPPARSVHFHLSLLSLEGDAITPSRHSEAPPEDLRKILELSSRLDTRRLTVVQGSGFDHGLVWEEGSIDLRTSAPHELEGKALRENLPEGEGEPVLRRFIDDSVNLLDEIEVNQRRRDQGIQPLNVLWPWGEGFREPVPNLLLQRGEPALVLSDSIRLAGLARLVHYRHGDRRLFGRGLNIRFGALLEAVARETLSIVVSDLPARLRQESRPEELDWLAAELESQILTPLLERAASESLRVAVVCPPTQPDQDGLAAVFDTNVKLSQRLPFDERALEERTLTKQTPWETLADSFKPPSAVVPS